MMKHPRGELAAHGLAASKSRGQNFLADPAVAREIVRRAELEPGAPVFEIGPGLGALTRVLLEAGHAVTAVEIDRGLVRYLQDQVQPAFPGRLNLIQGDVLKTDLAALAQDQGRPLDVIGNLPYQISTPLLFRFLETREAVAGAVLTFQKELAERLAAGPGSKAYGRLSVMFGYYARIERLLDLGPEAFHPRPKVGSTVLRVRFVADPRPPLRSAAMFSTVVAAGFSRRRKTLKNALRSSFPESQIDAALAAAGLDPGRRAETLAVEEFVLLTESWPAAIST
ncbi:MAG: ribosomal RNA small subunit methyltransferase A [Proteobacteria bacterium]|nr:ribosomal RNA small subunit methyltransferase A [Pseudomonadota bacterium]